MPIPDPPNQQPTLTIQLGELRELYSQVAKTEEEKKICQVNFESPRISDAADPGVKGALIHNELVELLGRWRKLLGGTRNLQVTIEQMLLEIKFMVQFYGKITLADIEWMMQLCITRQLPMTYPDYPSFNMEYLAKVILAYKGWKLKKSEPLNAAVAELRQMQKSNTPTSRVEYIKWRIKQIKEEIEAGKLVIFGVEDIYLYLTRTGRIGEGCYRRKEAKKYAEEQIAKLKRTWFGQNSPSVRERMQGPKIDPAEEGRRREGFTRQFCLMQYFKAHPIESIINQVQGKDFM